MSYDELVKSLRDISWKYGIYGTEKAIVLQDAADAMEQLLKVAKKMHLWIFLHSGDEQEAYDWCGLSDEMNAALGYGGQFELRAEPPETVYYPQVDGVTPMVVAPKEESE